MPLGEKGDGSRKCKIAAVAVPSNGPPDFQQLICLGELPLLFFHAHFHPKRLGEKPRNLAKAVIPLRKLYSIKMKCNWFGAVGRPQQKARNVLAAKHEENFNFSSEERKQICLKAFIEK